MDVTIPNILFPNIASCVCTQEVNVEFLEQWDDHSSRDWERWSVTNQLPFLRAQKTVVALVVSNQKVISVSACAETEVAVIGDKWFVSACAETEAVRAKPKRDFWERNCITLSTMSGERIFKQIDSILLCFCSVIKSKITWNVVRTKKWLKRRSRVRNRF